MASLPLSSSDISTSTSSIVDECDAIDAGEYDMGLHIGAVFIEIAVSFLGTLIPVIGKKVPSLKIDDFVFTLGKNFGTGVILSTAFIHMLAPAYESLSDECLGESWSEYPFAPLFALLAILSIQLIQTLATAHARKSLSGAAHDPLLSTEEAAEEHDEKHEGEHCHDHVHTLLLEKDRSARRISTYMLELGIATHSVIIGVSLGVARDEFKALLVALVFHQFFEGVALSTTVLDAGFKSMVQPIGVIIFYSLTTPLGIVIGICISSSFQEKATANLLVQGIIDAISAGILMYDGLVNMVNNNITRSDEFMGSSNIKKIATYAALWLGIVVMAIIGKWA